jgi:hypothetical protein
MGGMRSSTNELDLVNVEQNASYLALSTSSLLIKYLDMARFLLPEGREYDL